MSNLLSYGSKLLLYAKNLVYTSEEPVEICENRFLRRLTHKYYRYYVEISENCRIWTLSSIPPPWEEHNITVRPLPSVVLIHGLALGLAYWAMNIDSILSSGHDVYALDLPGFARSSRITFSEDGLETERIFIDIIHQWKQKLHINEMILVGHSFGGYISTLYSLSYPTTIKKVMLVDPWGFPDVSEEVTAVVEAGDFSLLAAPISEFPIWLRIIATILTPLSPFTITRFFGHRIGPRLVHMFRPDFAQRFAKIFGDDDTDTVPQYIYHSNNFNPTGEEAFRSLSSSLGWAKRPLIKRIAEMDKNIPFTLIYGSQSWIDFQTGFEIQSILNRSVVDVFVIEGAGHHLFADEPDKFNSLMYKILMEVDPHEIYEFLDPLSASNNTLRIKDKSMV